MPEFNSFEDIVRFNDKNANDYGIKNFFANAPVMQVLPADYASNGIVDVYTRITSDPDVSFRTFNHGAVESIGTSEQVTVNLSILAESATVDKMEADVFRGGPEAKIKLAVDGKIRSGLVKTEKQLFYGLSADASGFPGLTDMDQYKYLSKTNVNTMVVNAGGTGSGLTDIWLLVADEQNLQLVLGQEGVVKIDETVVVRAIQTADANTNLAKVFPAYFTPVEGLVGVRIGTYTSAVRICNIDTTTHKATDSLVYDAIQKLAEAGKVATHIVMNARSQSQIQKSRTATNATGTPAPRPVDVDGIPLIVTPNIPNNVPAVVAAA